MLKRYVHGLGVDRPVVQFEGSDYSNKKYFVTNYQGSIIGITDGIGNLLETYKYTAYGEPKNLANNEYWGGSRFRYTGQIALPEAKLYYYKARVYDPAMGRFLQTDPIGTKDDMDLYAYVGDDPVNKTDPTGEQSIGHNGGPPLEDIKIKEIPKATPMIVRATALGAAIVGVTSFAPAPDKNIINPIKSKVDNIINEHLTQSDLTAAKRLNESN